MPELTPIRRWYSTTSRFTSHSVPGPAEFIKLALDHLEIPWIYLKRTLRLEIAGGASFQVHYFDIDPENVPSDTLRRIKSSSKLERGQWLVAKHLAQAAPEVLEMIETTDADSDRVRLEPIVQEMRVLAHDPLRSHANIVRLLGFSWEKHHDEFNRRWPVLIMEAADCGSLKHFLELADSSVKTPDLGISIALDIASGLEALHNCGVVHGDLKPENVLVFQQSREVFRAKLSDFGFASLTKDLLSEQPDGPVRASLSGFSPPWEAPEAPEEMLLEDLPKVDVYGFGLLFCHLTALGADVFSDFCQQDPLSEACIQYDLDKIAVLKNDSKAMFSHVKQLISSKRHMTHDEDVQSSQIIALTLDRLPENRGDMTVIRSILCEAAVAGQGSVDFAPVPLLPPDDSHSDDHVEYQDLTRWDQDLMLAASEDVIANWHQRSLMDIASDDPDRVLRGAQRLFWLSRGLISGALGPDQLPRALEWLLVSAEAGSIEAEASIYNLFSALGKPVPVDAMRHWLVHACYAGEAQAESNLKELFPDSYPAVLACLKTIYCGYGQDCFGEQWRNEYPLDHLVEMVEDLLGEGYDINELHDYPGLACNMSWLHYAASYGRVDVVQDLISKGADPNLANDYDETPLFMACQAGHLEVARFLCPLTRNGRSQSDVFASNELHHLRRFDQNNMSSAANLLKDWGANIDQQNSDRHQTPLTFILNQHMPNCMDAAKTLLVLGADTLIKDHHGLDGLSHAACQLSSDLVQLILQYIPTHSLPRCKAEALCFVLEMDNYEILVNGASLYIDKVEGILKQLIDSESKRTFHEITGHTLLVFACARASVAVVQSLLKLMPQSSLNQWTTSPEEWYTPLMAAVVRNRVETVEHLIKHGADASLSDQRTNWTPLFYAVSRRPQIVRALVQSIEKMHSRETAIGYVNSRDKAGATALDIAVSGEFFEAADILAAYQPDFLACTFPYIPGSTTLFNSLGLAFDKASQLRYLLDLIQTGAGLPKIDNEGVTVLHAVCGVTIERAPEDEVVSIIDHVVSRFSSPDCANCLSGAADTPLHFAARSGNIIAIRKLEEAYGETLDWHTINNKGWSALDEAESRDFQDISDLGYVARAQFRKRTEQTVTLLLQKGVGRKRRKRDF